MTYALGGIETAGRGGVSVWDVFVARPAAYRLLMVWLDLPVPDGASLVVARILLGVGLGIDPSTGEHPVAAVVQHGCGPLREHDRRFAVDVHDRHQRRRGAWFGDVVDPVDPRGWQLRAKRSHVVEREPSVRLGQVRPGWFPGRGQARR